jgi:hypothetical protein
MRRDKYDSVISDLVRQRADMRCQYQNCSYASPSEKDRNLHASHFNSRGAGNVCRYDTDLIFSLCAHHHKYVENHPQEHTKMVEKLVGKRFLENKAELHSKPYKMTKAEKEEMYLHYKSELARIKELRMNGKKGYIETISWF